MSYAPRTKLSCDSSACTVLNDDYVFITSGLGANQRMPLADWRIIVAGETVREEFIPLAGAIHSPLAPTPTVWSAPAPLGTPAPEPAADAPPTAAAIAVAAAAAAPIGTKWRWATNEHNYYVAIQTKHGVLQVKKSSWSPTTLYDMDLNRKMFATYEAWVVSLPAGGTITKTEPQDQLSDLERRKKNSIKVLAEGGTASAIETLQKLWKVRTLVCHCLSINQRIAYMEDRIASIRGELNRVTIEMDLAMPSHRRRLTRQLQHTIVSLAQLKATAARQTPEQNSECPTYMSDSYKEHLYIHTSQGKLQIAYDSLSKNIAVKVPTGPSPWMNKLNLVAKLEDLPFSIGAELRLSVSYRRREIDLAA